MQRQTRNQILSIMVSVKKGLSYYCRTKKAGLLPKCSEALRAVNSLCTAEFSADRAKFYDNAIKVVINKIISIDAGKAVPADSDAAIKSLDIISDQLRRDKEIKKEIIFLPYKASMWDSLESIWKAADEDKEHCTAYVIPIPYCDRNPDGSAAQWHCEADQFPDYVPITPFDKYDIAKHHPDAIFIHNPYDNYNIVTSVAPQYYSRELKKYTDMLVYVPYFVVNGGWPESHLQLSCYKNADKIIVQNDNLKIIAENILENQHKTLNDFLPANQLKALGSPKIDHVIYCENHVHVPDFWKDMINGRKVFFYNVSISGLLTFNDNSLNKIRDVFKYFAKHREYCLLWRPHPLLEATLHSMRPDLVSTYNELKAYFMRNKLGIYDTTADVDQSIAISDAYIGEGSSVVHLFGAAGKPIFSTNMLISNPANKYEESSLLFSNALIDNGDLYFTADTYNTLCKMDLNNSEIKTLARFPDFPFINGLHGFIAKFGDKLILPPLNGKTVQAYDLTSGKISDLFELQNPMDWGNLLYAVPYKDCLFFIPYRYQAIVKYNLKTKEVTYYADCLQELLPYINSRKSEIFGGYAVRENKLLLPAMQINKILEFNMEDGSFVFYDLGDTATGNMRIVEDKEDYWLIPWELGPIVKWNYNTKKAVSYNDYPADFVCNSVWGDGAGRKLPFVSSVKYKNKIYLFPNCSNMILTVDTASGLIAQLNLPLPYKIKDRKSLFYLQQAGFFFAEKYKDKIIALSSYARDLLVLDPQTEQVKSFPCRMAEKDAQQYFRPMRQSDFGTVGEDPYLTNENGLWRNIDAFCQYVQKDIHDKQLQKKAYSKIMENIDGTSGEKIHAYIMEQINGK